MFTKKYWNTWGKQSADEGAKTRDSRRSKKNKAKKNEVKRKVEDVMDDYSGDLNITTSSTESNKRKKDSVKKEKKKVIEAEKE